MNSYSWKKEAREPTSDCDPTGNQTSQEKTNLHLLPPSACSQHWILLPAHSFVETSRVSTSSAATTKLQGDNFQLRA
jgi:hypothetical protein